MQFRSFAADDAEFCFQLRNRAFTELFGSHLQPEEIAAAVNAYQPADFIRLAEQGAFFIVEQEGRRAGFFYLKRLDRSTAELCLIYIEPRFHRQGIGSGCIRYVGRWVASNWKGVRNLIVDTVIAGYNAEFYRKTGFASLGPADCFLSGKRLAALRLCKPVTSPLRRQ